MTIPLSKRVSVPKSIMFPANVAVVAVRASREVTTVGSNPAAVVLKLNSLP